MREASLFEQFDCFIGTVERALQCLDQYVNALRDLRVLDGLSDEIESLSCLVADSGVGVAETAGQAGHDYWQGGLELSGRAVGHYTQDPDITDLHAPILLVLQSPEQMRQKLLDRVRAQLHDK